MSLSLLLPAGLFALFALALPVLMHLQRRRQTPLPRLFAALAYIDPQALPRRRVRIVDWPLLLLRLLLIAAIALLLSQPLLHGRTGPNWVLLWPGLDPERAGAVPEDAELRWLLPGFPLVDAQAAPRTADADFAPMSLLRQLAFERPPEQLLSLRLPTQIDGLDGALPALGRAIDWQMIFAEVEARESAPAPPLQVALLGEPPAAFVALQNFFAAESEPRVLISDAQPERGAEVLLQFGSQPLPNVWQAWLEGGGRVLRIASGEGIDAEDTAADSASSAPQAQPLWQGQRAKLTAQRIGAGELRVLDCALAPACLPELYEGAFPDTFADWLADAPAPPDVAMAQSQAPIEGGPAPQPGGEPLRMPLLVLILLLLAAERWLAAARPRP